MNVYDSRHIAAHFSLSRATWVIAIWVAAILTAVVVTVFGTATAGPEPAATPAATDKLQGITPNSPDQPAASDLLPPYAY